MKLYSIIGVIACSAVISLWLREDVSSKINGVSLVAPRYEVIPEYFDPVVEINANAVAVIPYGFSPGNSELYFDHPRQWKGEKKEGICQQVSLAKSKGLKVMIKPHIWVRGQGWAGDFELSDENEWAEWESNYRNYIITYARIADSLSVDLYCIGTELRRVVVNRPEFWPKLIREVREVYSGRITYAANWDNYQNVSFWDQMDYIGVDAYFPLSQVENPSLEEIKSGWNTHKEGLKGISRLYDKPILFTEFGYQSAKGAAGNHWEVDKDDVDLNVQKGCYQVLFETFWDASWFAGGFFWKWHFKNDRGGENDPNFTPQGKPSTDVIRYWYSKTQ